MYDRNTSLYDDPRMGGDRFKSFNENNLVEESLKLIEVALTLGNKTAALDIQAKALAEVEDSRLRNALAVGDDREAQADAGKSATHSEAKLEVEEKSKPESEGGTR